MSTTRHLINRQRRLAAASAAAGERTVRPAADRTSGRKRDRSPDHTSDRSPDRATDRTSDRSGDRRTGRARDRTRRLSLGTPAPSSAAADPAVDPRDAPARRRTLPRIPAGFPLVLALLALLTVLLGGFAAWAAGKASALHDGAGTANAALTDTARTSEVKGTVAQDVNSVFSYDYADTARTDQAAARVLTGKAVQQYAGMIAQVKAQAPARKLVLTTTVTDSGVELIDGDRARVLVYADQSNTSTAKGASAGSTSAAAMFAVDVVRQGGTWKIASIDTFG
jgi:Mce-associated membrane protein